MNKNNALHRFRLWLKWGSYNRINRFRFDRAAREVLKTPAIECKDDGCVIVSLVSHRDLWMYLVSAKSFAHFFGRGRYVVINDGSLSQNDIRILKSQIVGLQVRHIADIPNSQCPKGGCWERFLCVADYVQDNYVIVLDADMVTQMNVSEVADCVELNKSFIMGLYEGQVIQSMKDVWTQEVGKFGKLEMGSSKGIQQVFDTNMDLITGYDHLLYLKGSGGFNGFAKRSLTREDIERFSREMQRIFDERWREWGTEQIAVCFFVANSPSASILPHPQYAIYYANSKIDYAGSAVLHFIGMSRFVKGFYKGSVQGVIKEMQ